MTIPHLTNIGRFISADTIAALIEGKSRRGEGAKGRRGEGALMDSSVAPAMGPSAPLKRARRLEFEGAP